jgi:hypothetical protein
MTAAPPSSALRLLRLLRPGQNPLARGVDRVEATVVKLSVLLALVLVPVALTLGSLTAESLAVKGEQQAAARHETVAVLTKDVPALSAETPGARAKAPARWQLPNGATRTGTIEASEGLKVGAEVSIWLDESGKPVSPPLSGSDVVAGGVLVVVLSWLSAVGLLAGICAGVHHLADRHRYRTWAAEWARGEPGWHGQTR